MQVIDLNRQPKEEWRPGVMTQMYVSALNGAAQLCVFEQWCEPGHGAFQSRDVHLYVLGWR